MDIPAPILRLLHDCDPGTLTWEGNLGFLIDRVLASDNWAAIRALRERVSDREIAERIRNTRGRKLSRRQLRFWQVVLELDSDDVDSWMTEPGRGTWDARSA